MFGVGEVKNGCCPFGDGTLKLTVPEEWTDDFLHVDTDSQKLKVHKFSFLGRHGQKRARLVCSWDSKIDSILEMNRWNKLVF